MSGPKKEEVQETGMELRELYFFARCITMIISKMILAEHVAHVGENTGCDEKT
jgi:hypothetical protein